MLLLFQLQLDLTSFFWLVFSLLLGLGYAFLLYRRKSAFSPFVKKTLFTFRALGVALICFLLFAPFIKQTETTLEKPLVIFAQDNSASLDASKPPGFNLDTYSGEIRALQQKLGEKYDIEFLTVGSEIKKGRDYKFDEKLTDLSSLFRFVRQAYSGRNIGAVVLATDGINNRGGDPLYESEPLKCPIFSIALGDTIPKKDVLVTNLNYNSIAYAGNDFEVVIVAEAFKAKGNSTVLTVSDESGKLVQKNIIINSNEHHRTIPVSLHAEKEGIHRYTVHMNVVPGELSRENNTADFYVEVIKGSQKIVVLADAPHPDIGALKQSIESNKNYEVKTVFTNQHYQEEIRSSDLVILYQLPSNTSSVAGLQAQLTTKPVLFFLGAQTNIDAFSNSQNMLEITRGGVAQEVTAVLNANFSLFVPMEELDRQLPRLGPLIAPFGKYRLKSPASALLAQKIGSVVTDRPLLLFSNTLEQKVGVFAGEGLWRWRLSDFQVNGSHHLVDDIISKTVQYLTNKEDLRRFRAYPTKNSYDENERIVLNAELYNESYELLNQPEVSLTLKSNNGKTYSFVFSRTANAYTLDAGPFAAGEYEFKATTSLGGKRYSSDGKFVISEQQMELRQTVANHQLLLNLARNSGGKMVSYKDLSSLYQLIDSNELIKTVSYENRRYEEMINLKWLFFLIVLLLSTEWFTRKRNGEL